MLLPLLGGLEMQVLEMSRAVRVRMGRAGRARVEELFDQEKQISRLEQLYRELL